MLNSSAVIKEIEWKPFDVQPQIISILVVTLIISVFSLVFYLKQKNIKANEAPTGIVLMGQMYVGYIRSLVVEILGSELEKLTPYFVFLFSYLGLSNLISIIGLENPTTSLTVTFSLGLITFIGMFLIGFKYQKISYLKKFCVCITIKKKKIPVMINPVEVISAVTPLISISFRLWGNIFAGSLINGLWFFLTAYLSSSISFLATFNLLFGLTIPAINLYFDLLCGIIQALVFTLLTMVYWSLEKQGHSESHNIAVTHIREKKINIKNNDINI